MAKGKILKIKKGYNPNCSSGMWYFAYFFGRLLIGGVIVIASVITSLIIYNFHIKKQQKIKAQELESTSYESQA